MVANSEINNQDAYESIPDFYAGKSVFITGGAGFLGKVLVEKLLYSCPDIENVYVLLRDKKNVSAENRLFNILNLPLFSRVRNERPEALKKIVLLKGDINEKNLNMTNQDLEILMKKVAVVIHTAALIKFNEPLKTVLASNVEGTRNVLNLCHKMKKLQVFVHVSTAYVNFDQTVLEEQVYPPPASIEEAHKFAEEDHTEAEIAKFLSGRPNTYNFTKALAEHLVSETHGDIPAVIIRPSIVTPSINEPVKGWVDNWYGATGFLTLIAKGICRAVYADSSNVLDLIPVDYTCNHALVAAARAKREPEVSVYNSCSGSSNPITMLQLKDLFCDAALKMNMNDLPYPHVMVITRRYWLVWLITAVSYLIAYIADAVTCCFTNRPGRYVKLIGQSVAIRNVLHHFTSNSWIMKTDRSSALHASLSPSDATMFPFLARDIRWPEYLPVYVHGVTQYLLHKEHTSRK